jgi:hypothetical protein
MAIRTTIQPVTGELLFGLRFMFPGKKTIADFQQG